MRKVQLYKRGKLFIGITCLLLLAMPASAQFTDSTALFVVADDANMNAAENAIVARLEGMGFTVAPIGQNNANDDATTGMSLILISATVSSGTVATNMPGLKTLAIPVIVWEPALYDDFGFQETASGEFSGTEIEIVNSEHPLAAGLSAGPVTFATTAKAVSFGTPQGDVIKIAVNPADTTQVVLFAYEKEASMFSGNAPARRIGTFLLNDVADALTDEGWALFNASVTWAMNAEGSTSVKRVANAPMLFTLHNNYPNPFNPMTIIPYTVHEQTNVRLSVFNVLGEKIETLVDGIKPAGNYSATFYARGISSGVYFYKLEAGKEVAVKRLMLIK